MCIKHLKASCAAGIFLAQHGVSSRVLDRAPGPSNHPQAHYINNRTMELFRSIRMPPPGSCATKASDIPGSHSLAAAVSALSPPLREWRSFRYVDALVDGTLFGEIDHFKGVFFCFSLFLSTSASRRVVCAVKCSEWLAHSTLAWCRSD